MKFQVNIQDCLDAAERALSEYSDSIRVSITSVPGYPDALTLRTDIMYKDQVHCSEFRIDRNASNIEFSARFSRNLQTIKRYCERASCT